MIDHIGIRVRDLARATAFYLKALEPLGYAVVMQVSAEEMGGGGAVGFGSPGGPEEFQSGKPSFWLSQADPPSGPIHVAFVGTSRESIDAFFRAALAAGGKDNGPPGLRPHYHANYYAAFVLDPDGNNVEAVSHVPA